jgi:hypothetical protein
MRRWGWKKEGRSFQFIAFVLICYSMLSTYGFMSSRISAMANHNAVIAMQKGQLDWTRGSSVNRELPKVERRLLRADTKELMKDLRASLAIIPDAQAQSIADALGGLAVEKVQRALIMISSGMAQTLKFVCLLCGVMMWPRRQTTGSSQQQRGSGPDGSSGPRLVHNSDPVVTTAPALSAASAPMSREAAAPPQPVVDQSLPGSSVSRQLSQPAVTTEPSCDNQQEPVVTTDLSCDNQQEPASEKWTLPRLNSFLLSGASGLSQRAIAHMSGYTQQGVSKARRKLHERQQRAAKRRDREQP